MHTLRLPEVFATTLRLFLDENVPDAVEGVLSARGHFVIKHRDALHQGASDKVVATTAMLNNAILISIDGDMTRMTGRYGKILPGFERLNVIKIGCKEPMAAARIEQALDFLMLEWKFCEEKPSRRMYVFIGSQELRTYR